MVSIFRFRSPVIVVRCTTIVALTIWQNTTNTNKENRTEFFSSSIFTFFWCQIWITFYQFFCVNKSDFLRQNSFNIKTSFYCQFCQTNSFINLFNCFFQVFDVATTIWNNFFPIPLVDINRVDWV